LIVAPPRDDFTGSLDRRQIGGPPPRKAFLKDRALENLQRRNLLPHHSVGGTVPPCSAPD